MVWTVLNKDQNKALDELIKEQNSDRVVALLGGALLDSSLEIALRLRLFQHEKILKKVFKVGGPLGNLGPKIDIAFLLYMFEKPTRNALYGLSEIRNLFAHKLNISFEAQDEKMQLAFEKINLHEGLTHYPKPFDNSPSEYPLEPINTPRDVFFVNLKLCLIELMRDQSKHHMWNNIPLNWKPPPKPE